MIAIRYTTLYILSLFIVFCSQGQTEYFATPERISEYNQEIVPQNFDTLLFRDALLYYCNEELRHLGYRQLQPHQVLSRAAQPYSIFMAETGESKTGLGGKKLTLESRLIASGGAIPSTEEITGKFSISKGKTKINYDTLALSIVFKWFNGKQIQSLSEETYIFCGVGAMPDATGKKIFIDVILGNYSSINKSGSLVLNHPNIATRSNYKLLPYDPKICKGVNKIKNINRFQNDIKVSESGTIYLESNEYKLFSKLLKLPTDAIAVDILSKSQFNCDNENIIDYNLPSRGYMLKPIPQKKILKMNEITGKDAKNNCKIALGVLPSGLENYELNLIIIQDKYTCAHIRKSYTISGESNTQIKFGILADTVTAFNTYSTHYIPEPDTTILEFKIPFELGKSNYNPDDIKPFIDALNEPDFIVNKLKISAYSSIDGEEGTNEKLREMRAQNIFDAFKKMNPGLETADIVTADTWSIFKTDIKGTKYDTISSLSKSDAAAYINKNFLQDSLEYILSKHRFAEIKMEVIYDIGGVKEKAFVIKKFNEALENGKLSQALSIEKYMMNKILRRQYPPGTVHDIKIPLDSSRFSGMELNRLWLEYRIENKEIDTAFYSQLSRMMLQNPDNDYIRFNHAYCRVLFDTITEESQIDNIQREIDGLLTSSLSKEIINPLNLKFQLQILSSINVDFEPTDENKLTITVLDKLKNIVELNDENWEQALNLSYLFIDMGDFKYACDILEPFILSKSANEDLTFTYLAICSNLKNKHQTGVFDKAIELALIWNKDRLCKLFSEHKFSYMVFENPNTKSAYCDSCN